MTSRHHDGPRPKSYLVGRTWFGGQRGRVLNREYPEQSPVEYRKRFRV